MFAEKIRPTERYVPIMVCPDCVQVGLQIDPRTNNPNYLIIESPCFTHLIIKNKIYSPINHRFPLHP